MMNPANIIEIRDLPECMSIYLLGGGGDIFAYAVQKCSTPSELLLSHPMVMYEALRRGLLIEPIQRLFECFFGHEPVLRTVIQVLQEELKHTTDRFFVLTGAICAMVNAVYTSDRVMLVEPCVEAEPVEDIEIYERIGEYDDALREMRQRVSILESQLRETLDELKAAVHVRRHRYNRTIVCIAFMRWRDEYRSKLRQFNAKQSKRVRRSEAQQKRIDSLTSELDALRDQLECVRKEC